ncbi:MAG: cupin domain-containing protein [Acutalibacteraceae bacterium]
MFKNIKSNALLRLKELVDYQPGQIVSKALVQNDSVSITLFAFDKGEEISTHVSSGDAMASVLDGKGRFTVGNDVFIISEGETLVMPKGVPHAVFGEEKFKMQLIVSF